MIHLLASARSGTVNSFVPRRTPISTLIIITTNFDIYAGAASFPASGTPGVAFQRDGRLDEAGCNKQVLGYRKYFHVDVVNLSLELAQPRGSTDMRMTNLS
jgi:hypothetical protein